jgi:murein DD-endopeptidase MepM/ murein hydrolase activator NlpD
VRGVRILVLLLAVTGCAIDGPAPVARRATPSPAGPPPSAPLVPPPVTSRFGEWRSEGGGPRPARHAGIDLRAPRGTPVLAAAAGVVLRTGRHPYAGRYVVVQHAPDLATVYYHLSALLVEPGATVQGGQTIGRVGASGNATAPHLHFGVCRREAAQCGQGIEAGWADPAAYWAEGTACPGAVRAGSVPAGRLTYPLPCAEAGAGPLPAAPTPTGPGLAAAR